MKYTLISSAALAIAYSVSAQVVFEDTFDTQSGANNQAINTDIGVTRQTGGTTTSNYTMTGANVGANVSTNDDNVTNNGSTSGNSMGRIRNNEQNAGATNGFLSLDTNFGASLAGQVYTISYDLYYNQRDTSTLDQWISFGIGDTSPVGSPAAGATDFGFLIRPDAVGNVGVGDNFGRFYDDGTFNGANDTSTVPSYISGYLTFLITIDETGANPIATVSVGGSDIVTNLSFDFESGDRYFAWGSHLGSDVNGDAGLEFADSFIDNVQISIVPEPSSFALLGGLFALSWVAIRRRG